MHLLTELARIELRRYDKTARVSHSTVGVPGDVPTFVSGDTFAQRGVEAPHDLKGQVADRFTLRHGLSDTEGAR